MEAAAATLHANVVIQFNDSPLNASLCLNGLSLHFQRYEKDDKYDTYKLTTIKININN